MANDRHASTGDFLRLQSRAGNRAVQTLVQTGQSTALHRTFAPGLVQRAPSPSGDSGSTKAPVKIKDKTLVDQKLAVVILEQAYGGYVKKIAGGSVVVLDQKAFKARYDKAFNDGESAKTEAYEDGGTVVVNQALQQVDTIPHEILHVNTSSDWDSFVCTAIDEGTTEYLTIKAIKAAGGKPTHSYPGEEGVIRTLVSRVGEELLMQAYFNGKTGALKSAVESKCQGTWAAFKAAMAKDEFAKAKVLLAPKST